MASCNTAGGHNKAGLHGISPWNITGNVVTFSAAPNNTGVTRTASINFTIRDMANSPRATLTVTQPSTTGPFISVSPDSWNPSNTGEARSFNVSASSSWQFSWSHNWLNDWSISGNVLTVRVPANNTGAERVGTLTFRLRDMPGVAERVVTVRQSAQTATVTWFNHDGSAIIETWNDGLINRVIGWLGINVPPRPFPDPQIPPEEFLGWFTEPQTPEARELDQHITTYNITPFSGTQILPGSLLVGNIRVYPHSRPRPAQVTLDFYRNHNLSDNTIHATLDRAPGAPMGPMPPEPLETSGRRFAGWFTVPMPTGGIRFTEGSTVPSIGRPYWARWTDTNRHYPRWWPPADSGMTTIPLSIHPNTSSAWLRRINAGVQNWNNVSFRTNVSFSAVVVPEVQPASHNVVSVVNYSNWSPLILGFMIPVVETGPRFGGELLGQSRYLARFNIQLHSGNIERNAIELGGNIEVDIVAASTMAHELGHVLGLDDNPNTPPGTSVMHQGSVTITSPQEFDIVSVNMIYN